MRLDKFLKISRLIKRRTVANEASDNGFVLLNYKPAKPSKEVKVGDVITILNKNGDKSFKVVYVPVGNVSAQCASSLYDIVE